MKKKTADLKVFISSRDATCLKSSGRVGRSAAAKSFDAEAVRLAVTAHIRHAETQYDSLLAQGCDRWEARADGRGR